MDTQKFQSITKRSIPKNIKSLRGFLGLTGYSKKVVKSYACIEIPPTSPLKKKSFVWISQANLTFSLLKDAMFSALVLETPTFGKTFIVTI